MIIPKIAFDIFISLAKELAALTPLAARPVLVSTPPNILWEAMLKRDRAIGECAVATTFSRGRPRFGSGASWRKHWCHRRKRLTAVR